MSGPPVYSFRKKVTETNEFKYTNSVSALETITVPATGTNDFIIDWGDGSATEHITTSSPSHEYVDADSYQISISGSMSLFAFNNGGSKLNITSLDQWGNMGIVSLIGTFRGCVNLTLIPDGPISGTVSVVNCISTFRDTGITNVDAALFSELVAVSNFEAVFLGSELSSIPSGLFDNNVNVRIFTNAFRDTEIGSIPSGLFDNNTAATTFNGTFLNAPIAAIPNRLFYNNSLVTDYNRTFRRTGASLPSEIFNLANLSIVTNFNECFDDITATFTGTIQDIWNFALSATSVNTFANQTNISNYADIPNNWKGL